MLQCPNASKLARLTANHRTAAAAVQPEDLISQFQVSSWNLVAERQNISWMLRKGLNVLGTVDAKHAVPAHPSRDDPLVVYLSSFFELWSWASALPVYWSKLTARKISSPFAAETLPALPKKRQLLNAGDRINFGYKSLTPEIAASNACFAQKRCFAFHRIATSQH